MPDGVSPDVGRSAEAAVVPNQQAKSEATVPASPPEVREGETSIPTDGTTTDGEVRPVDVAVDEVAEAASLADLATSGGSRGGSDIGPDAEENVNGQPYGTDAGGNDLIQTDDQQGKREESVNETPSSDQAPIQAESVATGGSGAESSGSTPNQPSEQATPQQLNRNASSDTLAGRFKHWVTIGRHERALARKNLMTTELLTADQQIARLISSANPQDRERVARYAREEGYINVQMVAADGSVKTVDLDDKLPTNVSHESLGQIDSLDLSDRQKRALPVLLREGEVSLIDQARTGKEGNVFDKKDNRLQIIQKEGDDILVIHATSVDGKQIRINSETHAIEPVEKGADLAFTFASYRITPKGEIITTAVQGSDTSELLDGELALQEQVKDIVESAENSQYKWIDEEWQVGATAVATAKLKEAGKQSGQGLDETRMISPEELQAAEAKTKKAKVRIVSVYRAVDLDGTNSDRKYQLQRESKALDLNSTAVEGALYYAGPAENARFVKEMNVRDANKLVDETRQTESGEQGEENPKIPLLVTANQKEQLDGLTRKGRADLFANQRMQDPEKYDIQVYAPDVQESASVDRAALLNETAASALTDAAQEQRFWESAIIRQNVRAELTEDADIALQILSIKPDLVYREGNGVTTRGVLGADRAAQVLELRIQNTFKENNPNNSRSMREIAREQFAIMAKELGITNEKQLEQWNAIRDRDYPLSDGEHIAKARTIKRDIKNGQTIEEWRQVVEAELALATDLTPDDQRAILNDITTPKIDIARVLSIRTKAELDAYDEELRSFGGLPESIKNSVRLDEELTDVMIAGVAGNFEERKRLEERFGDRLTDTQKKLLALVAPEPQQRKPLEEELTDGSVTAAKRNEVAIALGFKNAAEMDFLQQLAANPAFATLLTNGLKPNQS